MNFTFLTPVSDAVIAHNALTAQQALGKKIKIHSRQDGMPDLEGVQMAIIGVLENRNDVNYVGAPVNFDAVRKTIYTLFPGNWHTTVADLGDIQPGETVDDTYFAIRTAITGLVEKQIIPIILGGSQDIY